MKKLLAWAAVAAMMAAAFAVGTKPDPDAGTPAARADRLAATLRCPVCQGLAVGDSDSPTARDIRADIRRRIDAGESAEEIRAAYVERYGEWVLLRPRASGFAILVWALPIALVAGASVALAAVFWRWRRTVVLRSPTEEDRLLVSSARSGGA